LFTKFIFSLILVEKSYLGIRRVILILIVIIFIINVYIRLMFGLRLEVASFKFTIYVLIFFFFFLSVISNLNFKMGVYDKIKNFFEV